MVSPLSNVPDRQLLALDHAPPIANGIRLVDPRAALPDRFRGVFPYNLFNAVQSKCFDPVYKTNDNVVISAPTGSGKTAILELAICKLAHSRGNMNFKIVYLSPLKALCSERAIDWKRKFAPLGMEVAELTGDTSQVEMARVRQASIIVTTPEKWDSITRSWTDHRKLLELVELFLVDEVHLLNDARGSTIEAVVSRMKIRGANVRFIALSATVPNLDDVARWLGKDHADDGLTPAHQEKFGEEFRPVKLQKYVYGFDKRMNDFQFDDFLNEQLYSHIAKHSLKKPILVFCPSRKSCQKAAAKLAEEWNERQPQARPWPGPREQQRIPIISSELQAIVRYGVAFHHAGLEIQDRKSIEQAFLDGRLSVICCTSTLAMGLNLPCHMVVLKGTKGYQDGGLEELSDLEVMQMLGRAGRPQFGNSAVAVVLTRAGQKRHYEEMGSSQQILESTLHQNLTEHLNSEINLGTFQDIQNAKSWLKGTFLAVRLCQRPSYYKLTESGPNTAALDEILEEICKEDISKLREACLITSGETFRSTDYGRAMSKFVIKFNSMKKIIGIPRGAKMGQLLNAICEAEEFKDVRWKSHERDVFRELNKDQFIAYPIKDTVNTTAHKASLVVQIALGNVDLSNVPEYIRRPMVGETKAVLETMRRLVRAVVECKASDSDGATCRIALELERSMAAKSWEGRSVQLMQVPQIGPVLMRKFVAAGITTIHALAGAETSDLERIASRNPPFGKKIMDELEAFPRLTLEARITGHDPRNPDERPVARIDANLGYSNPKGKPKWRGRIPSVTFMAETTEGDLAYWWRGSLRKFKEENGNMVSVQFEVELNDYKEEIICHLAADEIVGTIVSTKVRHDLPASAFPPKPSQQSLAASRNPVVKIPAAASWLDDEIDDGDMLEMVKEDNKHQEDDFSDALDDEDLWLVMGRDGNIERNEQAPHTVATMDKKKRGNPRADTSGDISWQPVKLPNGKYKCNHPCADAGVKRSGRACSHKCCRDGVDNPRRPKKTISKRKAEDDQSITGMASKYMESKAPEKRVKMGEHSRTELRASKYTPVQELPAPAFTQNNAPTDLEDFDIDSEGLIDLTRVDSASDDNVQVPFKLTLGSSGVKEKAVDTHVGLQGGQSASTKDGPGDSVVDSLFKDESDEPAELSRAAWTAESSSAEAKYSHGLSAKSQLDTKKKAAPTKPAFGNDTPVYGRGNSSDTRLGAPKYFGGVARGDEDLLNSLAAVSSNSIHSPLEQEDSAVWGETEEEALASMSDVFSTDFVDLSMWDPVDQDNAGLPSTSVFEQTPKDTDSMALRTPHDDDAAAEDPPGGQDGLKEPEQGRFEWMTEADRKFIDEYLDLVELMD